MADESQDTAEILSELNSERLQVYIPAIVFISCLMVVGIAGNLIVLVLYSVRIHGQSTYQLFVQVLALYDLVASGAGMPGLLVDMTHPYLFQSRLSCKILRYGYHSVAFGSTMTHLLVGLDRYRRICCPLSSQINLKIARTALVVILCVAMVLATPTLIMNDAVEVVTRIENITGHECYISDLYSGTWFPVMYESLLALLVTICATVLIVFYTLIGRQLYRRSVRLDNPVVPRKERQSVHEATNSLDNPVVPQKERQSVHEATNSLHRGESSKDPQKQARFEKRAFNNTIGPISNVSHDYNSWNSDVLDDHTIEMKTKDNERSGSEDTKHSNGSVSGPPRINGLLENMKAARVMKRKSREMNSRKVTRVTFSLTMVFIGSYFPFLILKTITFADSDFQKRMSFAQEATYNVFAFAYAVNNVANPLVYIFMDTEFKRQCRYMLECLCILCKCK